MIKLPPNPLADCLAEIDGVHASCTPCSLSDSVRPRDCGQLISEQKSDGGCMRSSFPPLDLRSAFPISYLSFYLSTARALTHVRVPCHFLPYVNPLDSRNYSPKALVYRKTSRGHRLSQGRAWREALGKGSFSKRHRVCFLAGRPVGGSRLRDDQPRAFFKTYRTFGLAPTRQE